jgi:hypothetical protein
MWVCPRTATLLNYTSSVWKTLFERAPRFRSGNGADIATPARDLGNFSRPAKSQKQQRASALRNHICKLDGA